MKRKLTPIPSLCPEDLTERETLLLQLLGEREEYIQQLINENARLKGEKGKPKIKPSRLEPEKKSQQEEENSEDKASEENKEKKKRPGSAKRHKTASLPIHSTKIIQPTEQIPPDSEFKGYQDYTVQELIIRAHNTRYRLAMWKTPTGEYLKGKLPEQVRALGHFGSLLRSYILLPLSSLSCHPTIAIRTVKRVGNRYLIGTIEPTVSGRQRLLPCREARHLTSGAEGFELYQH